ncbi:MAG: TRAP transporter large permease subunit, partial [Clostridia bacterium]|nr:TRAP transporter large permease subunit [Clostridia bacterium]
FGSLAAGGALGNLIPPGIVQIIYGAMVEESVGRLFIACVIPGALAALLFMIYIGVRVALQPELVPVEGGRPTARDLLVSLVDIAPMVALMALVLGGIYFGWTTPTEAAALGAAGAFAVAALYRRLDWSSVRSAFAETVRTSCMVLFIILGAQMLSYALVNAGINRGVTEWVASLGLSKAALFVVVVVLYVILGCLVDGTSMILLTLPVLYPVVQQAGFDPVWFGTLLTILVELGQITPPVGLNLFVIHGISGGRPIGEVIRGALPYTLLFMVLVVLMWYFPSLALWLPSQIEAR